ncbi:MAG: sigma 54-interacting transcriptional regulator, partial [Bacillota bacterium]
MEKKPFSSIKEFIDLYYNELFEIFNCVNVGIYITDGEATTMILNRESEKTGGLTIEELIGRNMADLLREGYVTESASLKTIKSQKEESILQELGDGDHIYTSAVPLFKNDNIDIIVCTERNITETIQLKELLKEKEEITEKYETELEYLRKQNVSSVEEDIIVNSREMSEILEMALRIARLDTTVLITGESGTGKEVLANIIYKNSLRNNEPFI